MAHCTTCVVCLTLLLAYYNSLYLQLRAYLHLGKSTESEVTEVHLKYLHSACPDLPHISEIDVNKKIKIDPWDLR